MSVRDVSGLNIPGIEREILTTINLVLRPLRADDAQDIVGLANNYNVASMLASMPYPYFDRDAKEIIEKVSDPEFANRVYAITHAETGELMGMCGLSEADERYDLPYIGYWLGERYWGNGYATEVARALVDLFFKTTDGDVLLVSVLTSNVASRRVIEKCGGQYWKRTFEYSKIFKRRRSVDQFRITRENWMGAAAA